MKYKLFAIDLDGTLLSKNKKIKKENLIALKKYQDSGGEPVIITGKEVSSAKYYINIINGYTGHKIKYLGALNGNIIIDLLTDEIIYSQKLENDICKKIYDIVERNKICFWPYIVGLIEKNIIPITGFKVYKIITKFNLKNKIIKLKKYENMTCYKINIISTSFFQRKIKNTYQEIIDTFTKNEIDVSKTSTLMLEVVKHGSNKGNALEIICEKLNIDLKETATIGDSFNDVPMFIKSGMAIGAKIHKSYRVKEYVDEIMQTKKHDGVAMAINNILLK